MLRFAEDACVQCGLCKATCPEKVITLKPQLDFRAATARARVLKEEEPFCCIRCGKPFGVKSAIERVAAKLEGKHWMFQNSAKRLDVIKMCADCRVDRDDRGELRSVRRARAAEAAHHGGLSARARREGRGLGSFPLVPACVSSERSGVLRLSLPRRGRVVAEGDRVGLFRLQRGVDRFQHSG